MPHNIHCPQALLIILGENPRICANDMIPVAPLPIMVLSAKAGGAQPRVCNAQGPTVLSESHAASPSSAALPRALAVLPTLCYSTTTNQCMFQGLLDSLWSLTGVVRTKTQQLAKKSNLFCVFFLLQVLVLASSETH